MFALPEHEREAFFSLLDEYFSARPHLVPDYHPPKSTSGFQTAAGKKAPPPPPGASFVIEVDGEPAGLMGFQVANRRSRIANLGSLAVHPDFRGRRLADEPDPAAVPGPHDETGRGASSGHLVRDDRGGD